MYRPAVSLRLASAPATVTVTTGRGDSLFRLAAAWRACPKAEASLSDEGAGPLFEAVTSDERAANAPAAAPAARVSRERVTSR